MPVAKLPDADALAEMLANLYGIDVTVLPTLSIGGGTATISVDYVGPDKVVCVSIVADLAAVASLGAAVTGIPPETVEEAVSSGNLPDTLVENYAEICNILSTLLTISEGSAEMNPVDGLLAVRPHRKKKRWRPSDVRFCRRILQGTLVFH